MNVSTAAVSFDDGAAGIELSDGRAAVPEQGSLDFAYGRTGARSAPRELLLGADP
jgi:hypothetical protein